MGKGLVIYKSKYGATKKYADMLKKELACDVCDLIPLLEYINSGT